MTDTQTSAWQPIETAPKDGTDIIVCWDAPNPEYKAVGICFWNEGLGEWFSQIYEYPEVYGIARKPTHWQPKPSAKGLDK